MTEYPSIVQIETAGTCNAACGFCPHSTMNRGAKDRMSGFLMLDIVSEITFWEKHPAYILPFLTNEPFADNRIYTFCALVNDRLPNTKLAFFTNGSLFTDGNLDKLETVQNIDFIHVSLHHSNAEEYKAELRLDFDKTIASIHRLIARGKWNVRLGRVQNGDAEADKRFLDFCAKEFPGTPACLSYRYNWKGDIASSFGYADTLDIKCPRHGSMTILCDGRVALCCMDERGEYALGDANTQSLLEIYNSPKAVAYRTKTKRESEPCRTCNMRA